MVQHGKVLSDLFHSVLLHDRFLDITIYRLIRDITRYCILKAGFLTSPLGVKSKSLSMKIALNSAPFFPHPHSTVLLSINEKTKHPGDG
jgi:hypothetical protein